MASDKGKTYKQKSPTWMHYRQGKDGLGESQRWVNLKTKHMENTKATTNKKLINIIIQTKYFEKQTKN